MDSELASRFSVCERCVLTAGAALTGDNEGRLRFKYASCDGLIDGSASSPSFPNAASSKYRSESVFVGAN